MQWNLLPEKPPPNESHSLSEGRMMNTRRSTARQIQVQKIRDDALRATLLSETEATALVAGLISALRKHTDDPEIIEAMNREIELLLVN